MLATQTNQIQKLEAEIQLLRQANALLREQFEWLRRQVFGQKSEKHISTGADKQLVFEGFDVVDSTAKQEKGPVAGHERKKPSRDGEHSVSVPENLPVERKVIDLPDDKKVCPETGVSLVKIGEEVSRKIAYEPGRCYIKETVRIKYALPEGAGIVCPELPDSFLPRCVADESLIAEILVRKFADHSPLYRTEDIFQRDGINIPRQVMSQWVIAAGTALAPLTQKMMELILQSGNISIDESPVDLLAPGKGKTQTGYMWTIAGGRSKDPPYRVYTFCQNRQHINAEKLLKGYKGNFHSDKYGAYEKIAKGKDVVWCPCWAHIRRKFIEAESGDPELREWVLEQIQQLFKLEQEAWELTPEERLRIRQEQEVPIIDALIQRIQERLIKGKLLPKLKFRGALDYFCGLIPYLKNYTTSPWARLDNNVAERTIRPLAIGRKNWLFFGSHSGGQAAAVILSLIQSCRALDINPREYLVDVMRRLMSHSSSKLEELLPEQWAAKRRLALNILSIR